MWDIIGSSFKVVFLKLFSLKWYFCDICQLLWRQGFHLDWICLKLESVCCRISCRACGFRRGKLIPLVCSACSQHNASGTAPRAASKQRVASHGSMTTHPITDSSHESLIKLDFEFLLPFHYLNLLVHSCYTMNRGLFLYCFSQFCIVAYQLYKR